MATAFTAGSLALGCSLLPQPCAAKDFGTTVFPPVATALVEGDIAFRQHIGRHTTGPNWPTFLTFASRCIQVHNQL